MESDYTLPSEQGASYENDSFIEEVFSTELKEIRARRCTHLCDHCGDGLEDGAPSSDRGLIGLAFSGGGIRSATFNLGFLQAFAGVGRPVPRIIEGKVTEKNSTFIWLYPLDNTNNLQRHKVKIGNPPPENLPDIETQVVILVSAGSITPTVETWLPYDQKRQVIFPWFCGHLTKYG